MEKPLPPTGGGPPVITHSALILPSANGTPQLPLTLTLTASPEAEAAGRELVELVRDACHRRDLGEVATLRFFFREVTERVSEFHALMDGLVESGDAASVERIMRDPGSPGRPRDSLVHVALIEQVMSEHQGWGAKQAATWLVENLRGKTPIPIPGEKRLQNVYSELKHVLRLRHQSLYVRGNLLVATPWLAPGSVPWLEWFLTNAVATQLSNAVVFHLPQDHITEGTSHVEVISRGKQQQIEPDESAAPGVSEQPAGKREQPGGG